MVEMAGLRVATLEDVDRIAEIYGRYVEGSPASFEVEPPTANEMEERIAEGLQRFPWLVGVWEGRVVGYAYGSGFRSRQAYQWSVEASVYLAEDIRGHGFGKALGVALNTILREQGFVNLFGVVTLPNPASVALMESLGMTKAGVWRQVGYKQGEWHDVGVWQRRINEPVNEPEPPTPFPDMEGGVVDQAVSLGEDYIGV